MYIDLYWKPLLSPLDVQVNALALPAECAKFLPMNNNPPIS